MPPEAPVVLKLRLLQRRRSAWIAAATLLALATAGGLLVVDRQAIKVAAMQWWVGSPPAAQLFDPYDAQSDASIPVRAGERTLPDSGRRLYFSPWNWAFSDGQAVSNTPGAYFKIRFTGRHLVARFDTAWLRASAYPASSYPAVTASVDGGPPRRLALGPDRAELDLVDGLPLDPDPDHVHTAVVHFTATHFDRGDRWNTPVAALRLIGLDLEPGATLGTAPVRPRQILVYADSHGEGVELAGAGSRTVNQDARRAFPQLMAEAWDAEVGVVAFGGSGYVTQVPGAELPPTTDTWASVWDEVSRLCDEGRLLPPPDAILSALGDNDPDHADVSRAAAGLARAWRRAAPDAELLFALPPNGGADGFRERLLAGLAPVIDPRLLILDPGQDFLAQPALSFGNHLNADGQIAYARALLAAYRSHPGSTTRTRPCPVNAALHLDQDTSGVTDRFGCLVRLRSPSVRFVCDAH